jgi:hypothetical protein
MYHDMIAVSTRSSTRWVYVTALYRRFGVNSRAQLLAHVNKRVARREWKDGLNL